MAGLSVKDINVRDKRGNTPLHYAAYFGNYSLCQRLISAGAFVNVQNMVGQTSLHKAFQANKEMVRCMLK